MSFVVSTLEEFHTFLVGLTKALLPLIDVSPKSYPALLTKTAAACATDNHAHIEAVKLDLLPDTAGDDGMLDRWGGIVGRVRKGATPARRANALRLVNNDSVGHGVTAGDALVHTSGLRFAINETATVPAQSTLDVDVVAVDTGSATRLPAGELLRFVVPPTGIEEEAELQLALSEDGDDREGAGAYRARILARFATPPLGGAQNDYVTWSLELAGIASAYCYPNRAGLGTVDVAALHAGTGTARLLDAGERATLAAYLETKRPVHAGVRVLEVVSQAVNVEVVVQDDGRESAAWDWIDEVPLTVSAWNGGTRTLTFTTDRPDSMQAGHRVVLAPVSGLGDGAPLVIESLSGSNAVVLEVAPGVAPVSTDVVYAGGGLTDPVRSALADHLASLGTANPDATTYGTWEGNLRLSAISRVVSDVEGVRDLGIIAPVANVAGIDLPFPYDYAIALLVPLRLLVRKKWS